MLDLEAIAEDLAEKRELLREPIEPHGFDPFLVPNGSLALTLAHQLQPNLSLQLRQAAENYASSELMRLLDSLEKSAGLNPSIDHLRQFVRSGQKGGIHRQGFRPQISLALGASVSQPSGSQTSSGRR